MISQHETLGHEAIINKIRLFVGVVLKGLIIFPLFLHIYKWCLGVNKVRNYDI